MHTTLEAHKGHFERTRNRLARSKKAFQVYFSAALIFYLAIASGLIFGAFYFEPYSGDLTRTGGFSENAFGWTRPQSYFSPPLVTMGNLDETYDVIVLGDSFSMTDYKTDAENGRRWTNHFRQLTGLRLGLFHINDVSLEQIVASKGFKQSPPKFVIWEKVERELFASRSSASDQTSRLKTPDERTSPDQTHHNNADCRSFAMIAPKAIPVSQIAASESLFIRPNAGDVSDKHVGEVFNLFVKRLWRTFTGTEAADVRRLRLKRADLFSNRDSAHLLSYAGDIGFREVSAHSIDRLACQLAQYQDLLHGQGVGFFILIVPDKTTAYVKFLEGDTAIRSGVSARLAQHPDLNLFRVDRVIEGLLDASTVDVYLPNDTHWSAETFKRVAQAVVDDLAASGWLNRTH